jgi:hypothetical protein
MGEFNSFGDELMDLVRCTYNLTLTILLLRVYRIHVNVLSPLLTKGVTYR